jgi:hypothetical protein
MTKPTTSRRNLLGALGATAVAVAAVATRQPSPAAVATVAEPAQAVDGQKGYQLTEHVQRYYRSTQA